jgi:F0F1-type ATP synthase assembly protein I
MKLLPTQKRVATDDALGMAIEIAVIMTLFVGGGFALDRWLGTLPLFMIVGTVLGAVGLFTKQKYRYDQKMDAFDAERRDAIARRSGTPSSESIGGPRG